MPAMSTAVKASARPGQRHRVSAFRIVCLVCAVALAWAFTQRNEGTISARYGLGYGLGIFGTGCMALLVLYSLRKRLRALSGLAPLRHWFNLHMILGIVGPAAILMHADFHLGSTNSNVALACVMLVAVSGVVGRLVYPKIHHGLYGRRASLRELERDANVHREALGAALARSARLARELEILERAAARDADGPFEALLRYLQVNARAAKLRRACAVVPGGKRGGATRRALDEYVKRVRRVAGFAVYERFFALWHAVHLPLCVLLLGAVIAHVIAVHMY